MKIPNFGYHFARWRGNAIRERYRANLPETVRRTIDPPRQIDIEVFSYSNEDMLPEQIASVRSLLRFAGRPKSFTIVSDGSHSARSIDLLQNVDPSVRVRNPAPVPDTLPEKLRHYLANHPTGKQLALVMSLPLTHSALYIDSDVRFFPGAAELANLVVRQDASALYLADCQFSGDDRLIRDPSEKHNAVNTGVLLAYQKLDWSLAIDRFLQMQGDPSFFTNQTMTHLTMHQNNARPFDRRKFVLQLDDQTVWPDRHVGSDVVLRHYVNPVRHKFWTSPRY